MLFLKGPSSRRRNRPVRLINPTKDCRVSTFNEHRNILLHKQTEFVEDVVWPDQTRKAQPNRETRGAAFLESYQSTVSGCQPTSSGSRASWKICRNYKKQGSLFSSVPPRWLAQRTEIKASAVLQEVNWLFWIVAPQLLQDLHHPLQPFVHGEVKTKTSFVRNMFIFFS